MRCSVCSPPARAPALGWCWVPVPGLHPVETQGELCLLGSPRLRRCVAAVGMAVARWPGARVSHGPRSPTHTGLCAWDLGAYTISAVPVHSGKHSWVIKKAFLFPYFHISTAFSQLWPSKSRNLLKHSDF